MDLLVMEAANLHQEQRRKEKKKKGKRKERNKNEGFFQLYGEKERRDLAETDDFVVFPCSVCIVVS